MWRFNPEGLSLTLVNLIFNIILVFGLYLFINFFRKMIAYGKGQSKYIELILGIIITALGLFLKFYVLA
jgi:multisubunit Na+/H+ antiporter MnhG subunit